MRRPSPRHVRDTLHIRPYTAQGWAGSFADDPVTVRAHVQHTRHVGFDDDGVRVASVLTARIPGRQDGRGPTPADFPPGSEVATADGELSWVVAARPITSHGALAHLELTTGDRRPLFGGWLVVDAVLERTGGRDRWGNPLPSEDVPVPVAVIRPVGSSDPVDRSQAPETTAELILPTDAPEVASTDRVRVPSGPMAGRYQVVGDPAPHPARTVVQLRRI